MKNRVCEILNIQYPVIQGPMAWITSSGLVAAVSNAGGLGVLGTSADFTEMIKDLSANVEEMRKTIRRTRTLTDKPFGINVFPAAADPYGFSKAMIALAKEEGVNILVVAGNVSPDEIKQWKKDGFIVIMREANPTVRGAQLAEAAGADIIVATGCDEGGCMPYLSTGTTAITALLADAVKIPVLAAGGIVNAKLAKAAQVVGAEGVFVGTRFTMSKECRAADATKQDILNTHPDDYIVFTQSGGTCKWRTTPHKYGKEGLEANRRGDLNPPSGSFYYGMLKGDMDAGVNTISNTSSLIKSIDSCEDIVKELGEVFMKSSNTVDFLSLAKSRYSERFYAPTPIEQEKLDKIIEAGRIAPTARNCQPQHFYIIRSQEGLAKLKTVTKYHYNAPAMILVCYDMQKVWKFDMDRNHPNYNSGEQDGSIAATSMMFEAESLGVHSVWVRDFDSKTAAETFGLPDNMMPVMLLGLGYPNDRAKPAAWHFQKNPVEDFVTEL
ncbi:MAG: nitronate monooxygenase [Proteobacteria bacterium]|nr:nitronate monooxygenase [Pseudomonadota bacterium]